ncbi:MULTISPECIES: SGNH/GDSL hydrolase family protein [Pontibacillus]|uniref:SGNH/GDSL hydrolase family protein n=1 Tax=Pontibacillus chungwhensis TaxID=265426 RepID=A0ABY8UXL6_9BACI|nr:MULTISPECIES: SGNH/GDSL hydrolase family protein [Pontibacillus]MCD5325729.1 SGNH/GDSL hydrolase family protein [Pontibacillus sp. HN14]WIF98033.1 SGNH/GDSL hydrolase family protein [Pontibacillus chungwhensis]
MKRIALTIIFLFSFLIILFYWVGNEARLSDSSLSQDGTEESSIQAIAEEEEEEEKTITEEIKEAVSTVLEGAKEIFVKDNINIVAIGDSLTQGVGDSSGNGGYVGIIEETLQENNQDFQIQNFGKRGNRTDQLLDRLKEEEIAASLQEADVVVITIGANDIMKVVKNNFTSLAYDDFRSELPQYEDRLSSIFKTIRSLNEDAHIYLVGLFNPFEQYFSDIPELDQIIYDWNRTSKDVVDRYSNVNYIPIKDLFSGSSEDLYYEDNFHPNLKGYRLMAERILSYLKDEIVHQNEEEI